MDKTLKSVVEKYLEGEALCFVLLFNEYCHYIDDMIDEGNTAPEDILTLCIKALDIYSSPFYQKNLSVLYPVVRVVTNMYGDSVVFEKSSDMKKQAYSVTLRHSCNEMWTTVIELCKGRTLARRASIELRELSLESHYNSQGEPI